MGFLTRAALFAAVATLWACGNDNSVDSGGNDKREPGSLSGIYSDDNLEYEFTPERVFVTAPLAGTTATDYEVDGKRVLVGMKGQQQVLTILEDGSLQGPMGIVLKKRRASVQTGGAGEAPDAPTGKSPGDVAEAYLAAMARLDLETAMGHVMHNEEFNSMPPAQVAAMKANMQSQLDAKGGMSEVRVLDEQIRGNEAMVEVETRFGSGEVQKESLRFVKQNNRWLLN